MNGIASALADKVLDYQQFRVKIQGERDYKKYLECKKVVIRYINGFKSCKSCVSLAGSVVLMFDRKVKRIYEKHVKSDEQNDNQGDLFLGECQSLHTSIERLAKNETYNEYRRKKSSLSGEIMKTKTTVSEWKKVKESFSVINAEVKEKVDQYFTTYKCQNSFDVKGF